MTARVKEIFSPERGLIDRYSFLSKVQNANLPLVTNNKDVTYYNVPCAFDIETSSFYNGVEYDSTGKESPRKCASMYIWQFGILNWVTYGRTWDEFLDFMVLLNGVLGLRRDVKLICYVHNLAYEFQWIRKLIKWDKVFLLEERKPVYAEWNGFEFRCSLKLSSKSLAKVGEDLVKYKEYKHVGDLDYSLIRFSGTPLTEEELGYCEADIRVLLAYIQEKIETDGSICNIPLTNTGYVRNFCRDKCYHKVDRKGKKLSNYSKYRALMESLTLDAEEYAQLKRGFAGGFTHASAKYVAQGKEEDLCDVGSFDFTSSYPAVMLSEKFPMSKSQVIEHIDGWKQFHYYLQNYCCLFDITLKKVIAKVDYDHPLSRSKVILPEDTEKRNKILSGIVEDNGRIVSAEEITLTMTEQDWFVFSNFYDFGDPETEDDDFQIHMFRIYEKDYLPKEFYSAILELYKRKTVLKGVDGEEVNYMISKNMANSAYGMTVTDIVRDVLDYNYDENDYIDKRKPNKAEIEELIDKYNKSKKRFMFYPWGVWVTSYARRNLFSGILATGNDYIYSDTDSIKIFNPESHMDYINEYNKMIIEKLEKAAKRNGIDSTELSPKNKYGEPKTVGVWDYEGKYKRFKTLGAKRYLIERYEHDINPKKGKNRYSLTVAGLNKEKACKYLTQKYQDPLKGFTTDLVVPAEYSGRLTLTYVDHPCEGEQTDYLGVKHYFYEESYIHMEPSDYNLTMSEAYLSFLHFAYGVQEDSW